METQELILKRYSPLIFTDKEISSEDIYNMLDAARWAPSAYNEQPWRFMYFRRDDVGYKILFESLFPANKEWAKTAPLLLLVIAKKNFTHNGKPNFHYMYDTGMAVQNLIISALAKGIYVHQMGGFDAEYLGEEFKISEEYTIIAVAAVGYPGNVQELPGHLYDRAQKPRIRKSIDEILL